MAETLATIAKKRCCIGDAAIELDIFQLVITAYSGLTEHGFPSPIPAVMEKFKRLYLFIDFVRRKDCRIGDATNGLEGLFSQNNSKIEVYIV